MAVAQTLNKFKDFLLPKGEVYDDDYSYYDDESVIRSKTSVREVRAGVVHSIVSFEPTSFEDVKEITETIRSGSTATINVGRVTKEEARRIVDFVSGVVAGIGGEIERIHTIVFIATPPVAEVLHNDDSISYN